MIGRFLRRLFGDRRGTLAVELGVALPILLTLALTGIEVTRYVLLNQKIERSSVTLADLVTQANNMSQAQLNALFDATQFVMSPYDLPANGQLIVSSISSTGTASPRVNWQRSFGGGGGGSAFGVEGGNAILPTGFVVRDGESIVVTEAFYDYEPAFFDSLLEPTTLYSFAIFRPRFSALTTIAP